MKSPIRCLLLVGVVALLSLAFDGPFSGVQPAAAQGFGRGRDGGGGGGEGRESFRRRFGGGEGGERGGGPGNSSFGGGGRDWRNRGGERGGGGGGDGERRGEGRSNGSGSSGSGSSSSSSGSSDSKSSTSSSTSISNEKYAKDLVEKYDKNGDKMLQKDEQSELNSTNRAADLDKDGVITIDELVAHHSTSASTAPPTTTSSPSGDSGSGGGDSGRRDGDRHKGDSEGGKRVFTGSAGGPNAKEGDKRRTYRFSTTTDRLPKNLPSYFSRDTDGDGQVSMSEYSRTWSKSTVAEFRKYDLNDDGIITAKEATHSSGSGG